jgi:hypothetical protein
METKLVYDEVQTTALITNSEVNNHWGDENCLPMQTGF